MTVAMSLAWRLRLARIAVDLTTDAPPGGIPVVPPGVGVLTLAGTSSDETVVAAWWAALSGRPGGRGPLLGLRPPADGGDAAWRSLVERCQPDVLLDGPDAPGWPHPWVLSGRSVRGDAVSAGVAPPEAPTGRRAPDFMVVREADGAPVTAATARRVAAALPADDPASVPWFAHVDSLAGAEAVVAAGVTRLALTVLDADLVEQCGHLVGAAWQTPAMRAYALSTLRGAHPGAAVLRADRNRPFPVAPADSRGRRHP